MSDVNLESGFEQMKFEMVDNGVVNLPTSHPATYSFQEPVELSKEAFEAQLDSHGFSLIETFVSEKETGEFYFKARVMTDHYKGITVKVWRDSANFYPQGNQLDMYEFSRLVHSVEEAFGSDLLHDSTEE